MNGRPQIYTDEYLDEKLNEFIKKYPDKTIGYPELEKETGVPKHIWKYRKADIIRSYNKNRNNKSPEPSGRVMFPSADDVMAKISEGFWNFWQKRTDIRTKKEPYRNWNRNTSPR